MELVKAIKIPVIVDSVLSPEVYYGDAITGICFQTHDEQFGRITFDNVDVIKVCRGEMLPYEYKWGTDDSETWIFKIENSKWLTERFDYENEHYGGSYEFGGNVNEMLTDCSHYLFSFHDQFVEVIARGFWFEKSNKNLFKQPLQSAHPFLKLPETEVKNFEIAGIKYKAIFNTIPIIDLIKASQYCQQPLIEIATEFEGKYSINYTLHIMHRQGKQISVLRHFFGQATFEKDGIATFDDIIPLIDKEIIEIAERRKLI
jgi:hypothetical protein